ncbi:hypothetical protein IM543_21685 [Massilia sp. UMI-21]|nr:hypothetical protein IM543_21685 [Massilia sp. UMI-21]
MRIKIRLWSSTSTFIEIQQHPTIEFDPAVGQAERGLVHYFSDRCDPFKSMLPLLIEGAGHEAKCSVSCDHIPRRSWPLFRAKAMLGDLIAGFSSPGIQSHQEQLAA